MAYQMAATAVTLNDLEGHSQVAGLFKCNPSNICAAFYTISTDSVLARFLCISSASCKHLRSLKVIRCCANRRRIYDLVLALSSNLSSVFKYSGDIMPSLHIHIPPLFQVELGKIQLGIGGHHDMLWCHGAQNTGVYNYKLKFALTCVI